MGEGDHLCISLSSGSSFAHRRRGTIELMETPALEPIIWHVGSTWVPGTAIRLGVDGRPAVVVREVFGAPTRRAVVAGHGESPGDNVRREPRGDLRLLSADRQRDGRGLHDPGGRAEGIRRAHGIGDRDCRHQISIRYASVAESTSHRACVRGSGGTELRNARVK